MLDVSRNRVPTVETVEWLIDVLAALRYTQLHLYIEHTFAYRDHREVWAEASPFTHEELSHLDRFGAERQVELVPNLNTFGHMERWLRHDRYRHRAECPDGAPALVGPALVPPTCLAPTPENAAFAVELAVELAACMSSQTIHIGADEPFELGRGRSAGAAAEGGRDAIYLEHLERLVRPLANQGRNVLFWGDLFRRDERAIDLLPAGATPVVWNYDPPDGGGLGSLPTELREVLGLPDDAEEGFIAHTRLLARSGKPFWVAVGTSTWNSFAGRNGCAAANIQDGASIGAAHDSPGFMLTDWGDNGHLAPLICSLPSLVRAAVASWTGGAHAPTDSVVGSAIDEILGSSAGFGSAIDALGRLGEGLSVVAMNASPLFTALFPTGLPVTGRPLDSEVADIAKGLEQFREALGALAIDGPRAEGIVAELRSAADLASIGLKRLAARHDIVVPSYLDEPDEDLAFEIFAAAWLMSSRPGGLTDTLDLRRS